MKNRKTVDTGDGIVAESSEWSFGGKVPESFTDHVSKSVPLYNLGQNLITEISEFFVTPSSTIYDLGSSTGVMTAKLADKHKNKKCKVIGIDCEPNMIKQARIDNPRENIVYKVGDILKAKIVKTDFIVLYYTMQFVPPKDRQLLFDNLYKSLNWGGGLVVFEKVRAPDARFQDYMTQIYNEYKLEVGYSEENIIAKSKSLKRVLEPYSTQANYDMMYRAGFKDIMTIQKYVSFEGFLLIK